MKIEDYYNQTLKDRKSADIVQHLPILKKYAKGCSHVTELGVRYIVSTWALLAGKPGRMVSIDLDNPAKYGADINLVYKASKSEGIRYEFIQADDLKIRIEPTDLLFIDTYHVYRQLKQELTLHGNMARKYIIMHDTAKFGIIGEDKGEGLNKAVMEFINENPEWALHEVYTNCNGLTILKRDGTL